MVWGRENKSKWMWNFHFIAVDNCESLLDTAFGSFLKVRLFFVKKTEKCCSLELSQRTLNGSCACELMLTKVSWQSKTNHSKLDNQHAKVCPHSCGLNSTRSFVITQDLVPLLQKLLRLSHTVFKERIFSFWNWSSSYEEEIVSNSYCLLTVNVCKTP